MRKRSSIATACAWEVRAQKLLRDRYSHRHENRGKHCAAEKPAQAAAAEPERCTPQRPTMLTVDAGPAGVAWGEPSAPEIADVVREKLRSFSCLQRGRGDRAGCTNWELEKDLFILREVRAQIQEMDHNRYADTQRENIRSGVQALDIVEEEYRRELR